MHEEVVVKIAKKIQDGIQKNFHTKQALQVDTLLNVARELGYVINRRGRGGGWEATDEGLEFGGYEVEKFRANEALEAQHRQERAKRDRERAREERQRAFQATLEHVTKSESHSSSRSHANN